MSSLRGKVVVPASANPWPHELRVAKILALAGHVVEFVPESYIKTADILLDGIGFEIKSPKSGNANSLEHILKKAVKQSYNIIIDTSRMRNVRDDNTRRFLINQARIRKQIKRLLMIIKQAQIVDISALVRYNENIEALARRRRYLPRELLFYHKITQNKKCDIMKTQNQPST